MIKKSVSLLVFVDESNLNGSSVMICSLAVEKDIFNRLIKRLIKKFGSLASIPEIHYKEFDRADYLRRDLAKTYIQYISDKIYENHIFLNIVIADKSKLNTGKKRGAERNSYLEKVFARLAITYAINRFSRSNKNVNVEKIVLDKGGKTDDNFFRQYAISKIKSKSKAILPSNIHYIDSNPKNESENNLPYCIFVNIVDLILGACKNCCADQKSSNNYKKEISELILNDLLFRLSKRRNRLGKINTYPRTKKLINYKEKLLSGEIKNNKKYLYSDDPKLRMKFSPKPYKKITDWSK